MNALSQLFNLRRCDTPLVGVRTPDPAAFMAIAGEQLNGTYPVVAWDSVRGLRGLNEPGKNCLAAIIPPSDIPGVDSAAQTRNPTEALVLAESLPEDCVIWAHNLHLMIEEPLVIQAVANLRDTFKGTGRTLIIVGVDLTTPPELAGDVIIIDDPLPSDDELATIAKSIYKAVDIQEPDDDQLSRIVDSLRGLSAFVAEQVAAVTIGKQGIDVGAAWDHKRAAIEASPGLTFDRSGLTFDNVRGLDNARKLGNAIMTGPARPALVLLLDEIEKSLAGSSGAGDTSGTSQDQLGVILRTMEDNNWTGIVCVGPPGSGKTLFSKALAGTGKVPGIKADLGATKGSLVGQSEKMIREMIKTINGLAGNRRIFVVATCNKLETLPPELRRRFKLGIMFFDLPTADERDDIWSLYLDKFDLDASQDRPNDEGWTGAEIRNVCELAYDLGISIAEAANFIVPVNRANPESITMLRNAANGRFLSATSEGVYEAPGAATAPSKARRLTVKE